MDKAVSFVSFSLSQVHSSLSVVLWPVILPASCLALYWAQASVRAKAVLIAETTVDVSGVRIAPTLPILVIISKSLLRYCCIILKRALTKDTRALRTNCCHAISQTNLMPSWTANWALVSRPPKIDLICLSKTQRVASVIGFRKSPTSLRIYLSVLALLVAIPKPSPISPQIQTIAKRRWNQVIVLTVCIKNFKDKIIIYFVAFVKSDILKK